MPSWALQEFYPLSLRLLTTVMGDPRTPEAKVRINTEAKDRTLSRDMEAELRTLNAVDIGIFQAFHAKWRHIRDDLRDYLKHLPKKA